MREISERQRTALHLLAAGETVGAIATQLRVTTNTASQDLAALRDLLGANTNPQLVYLAAQDGLLGQDVFAGACPTCGRPA